MRIGANLWIWDSPVDQTAIERRAPQLASWGFDVIELPLETPESWQPDQVRSVLETTGLKPAVCIAMSPDRDLVSEDAETVRRTQDYLITAIEKAAAIGASTVAGPMYSPTGVTRIFEPEQRLQTIERLAENLNPVLQTAVATGVKMAIEPLNRFETSLFNTVEQLQEFLDLAGNPQLGMLLDTFHMNIEEKDMPAAIRAAGSSLFHFHACGNDRGAPGNGSIPWSAAALALRDIAYDGSLVIESFVASNKTIASAAAIWRPLAASQDAIATDGLAFLREL